LLTCPSPASLRSAPSPRKRGARVGSIRLHISLVDDHLEATGIAAHAGSRIEAAPGGAGVRVLSPDGSARVRLDGWRPGPGGRLALHLVLQAPAATRASLWYQTRVEPRFHPRRRNVLELAPGRNEFFLRLPEAGIQGALLFQPGAVAGEYLIERCEGRSGT